MSSFVKKSAAGKSNYESKREQFLVTTTVVNDNVYWALDIHLSMIELQH